MYLFAIRNNKQREELIGMIKNYRLPFKGVLQDIYPNRTVGANAFYWGVLLKILSDELDHTPRELSEFFYSEIGFKTGGMIQAIKRFFNNKKNKKESESKNTSPEELHIFFRATFLLQYKPDKQGIWNLRVISTTELNQKEFMDYCMRIRAYAMIHWEISLPLPNEVITNE